MTSWRSYWTGCAAAMFSVLLIMLLGLPYGEVSVAISTVLYIVFAAVSRD